MSNKINKRKYHRIDSINCINFTCHDDQHHVIGQGMGITLNLSESGMLIDIPVPLESCHTISGSIGIDDNLISFHGRAVYSKQADVSGFYTGVQLLHTRKEELLAFCNHLKTIRIKAGLPVKMARPEKLNKPLPHVPGPPIDFLYVIEEESYERGARITEEGKFGTWAWVILDGNADIVRKTPNGQMSILNIGPGSFIGNIRSFLTRNYPRTSTVIARKRMLLGLLDTERLADEYTTMSSEMRILLWSLNDRLRRITDQMIHVLITQERRSDFVRKGRLWVPRDQKNGDLFIIAQGKATVMLHTAKGPIPVINLQKGDLVGSLPFLQMGLVPEHVSVVVSEDIKNIAMDVKKLHREHDRLSLTYRNIVGNTVNRISAINRILCDLQSKFSPV